MAKRRLPGPLLLIAFLLPATKGHGTIRVKEGGAANVARFFDDCETPDPNAIRLIAR